MKMPPKKKLFIGLGATGIALLIGGYIVSSWLIWSHYKTQYEAWQHTIQSKVDTALKLPGTSSEKRKAKMVALEVISTAVRGQKDTLCNSNQLYAWQIGLLSDLRAMQATCKQMTTQVNEMAQKIDALVMYVKSEQDLAKVISGASLQKSEINENEIAGQVVSWQTACDSIRGMAISSEFKPIKDVAITKVQAVVDSWKSVTAAHQAKDKTKFTDALVRLKVSYSELTLVKTENEGHYQKLIDALNSSYSQFSRIQKA